MGAPEIPLRVVYFDEEQQEDFAISPAAVCEIVSVPQLGLERIRGYYADTGDMFSERTARLRSNTVRYWWELTHERLTPSLEPAADARAKRGRRT